MMTQFLRQSVLLCCAALTLQAAPQFQFDFNDLSFAVLKGQTDDSPNGNGVWAGQSSVPRVEAGNLVAPGGLNYAFSPAGTAGHFLATRTDTSFRGQFHRVVPSGGVMWISALVKAVDGSAAAVVIDGADTNNLEGWSLQNKGGFGIRPDATAGTTELFWSDNLIDLAGNQSAILPTDYSDQVVLLLARVDLGGAGNNVDLWVNPVLVDAATLGTVGDLEASTSYNVVEWVGAGAVNTGLVGYTVEFDNLAFSNDAYEEIAFAEVAGLPVPPPPPPDPEVIALRFDFNNLVVGPLNGQTDDSPDAVGNWTGTSGVPSVNLGDLTAPVGTNYEVSTTGTSGRGLLSRADSVYRAQFHQVTPGDGVMWFSALINAADSTAAAVAIEGSSADAGLNGKAGFGIRPDAGAGTTELFWSDDLSSMAGNQSVVLPANYAGQTVLVLGRLDFAAGADKIDLWLNPVLTDRASFGTSGDLSATTALTQMDWTGIGVADDGTAGFTAYFDNVLFSNDPNEDTAFFNVTGVLPLPIFGAADINGNGLSDLAELLYPGISELPGGVDSDHDGFTNAQEAAAGTDPFDFQSRLYSVSMLPSATLPDTFEFLFTSVPGVRYGIQVSADLETWGSFGSEVIATGAVTTILLPIADLPPGDRAFVRAEVLPAVDSDSDGLEDALEVYLGFDPASATSVRAYENGGDLQQFVTFMTGGNPQGGLFGTAAAGVPSEEQASRFLAQATFGPTLDKITALRSLGPNGYETWIDQQLALSPNYLRTYIDLLAARMVSDAAAPDYNVFPHYVTVQTDFAMFRENVNTVWMRQALFAPDELRQRMAWALSQIAPIGPRCNSYGIAAADWYDTVLRHSFGNYRDLLYDISVHPWMGFWLSHIGNRQADPTINRMPDENFGREIMQLFSIGLIQLNMDGTPVLDPMGNPVETYTNEDITQISRVFTGLDAQAGVSGRAIYSAAPMQMYEDRHDDGNDILAEVYCRKDALGNCLEPFSESGKKRFLGHELPRFQDDPGRSGLDDVRDAVDILFNHPNCPPFICKNLIQHLVSSNPTPEYVERVATVFVDDGTGVRGNLSAVVKAILLDPEARNLSAALDSVSGRLKGPMLRTVAVARAFEAGAATPALHDLTGIQFWSPRKTVMFGDFLEYPFEYPSVFNFYEPAYSRPGEVRDLGLLSPEFQIMNGLTATTTPNRFWWFIRNGFHDKKPSVTPDFELQLESMRTISVDTDLLLDRLNLLLCHGALSPAGRAEMKASIDYYAATDPNWVNRTDLAVYLSLVSPDSAVLK